MLQSPRLNATVWYPVFQRFLLNFVPWCEMPDRGICNIIMTNCTQFHLLGVDKQGKEEMEGLMSMTQAQWDEWVPSLLAGWARDLINKFHYLDPTLVRVQLFEVQTTTPSALRGTAWGVDWSWASGLFKPCSYHFLLTRSLWAECFCPPQIHMLERWALMWLYLGIGLGGDKD